MVDRSHLDAIQLRLSHERARLSSARTLKEKRQREIWVAQIEKELADEYRFLGIQPDTSAEELSDDELMAELESNGSPLEWVKGSGVDRDGHSLAWWKSKVAKWSKSIHDRPSVVVRVITWDRLGKRDPEWSREFSPDELKEAKAFARDAAEAGRAAEVEGRVEIPYQGSYTVEIGEWKNSASNGYYVWSVDGETFVPVTRRGPFADYEEALTLAKQAVRAGSVYDEVITFGGDPEARDFEIAKAFKARSGEVHYATDLPRVGKRLGEYRTNARPQILIVSTNLVSDEELGKHGLETRRYMRIGPSGTGQRIRPSPIDMIKVETHPEWARATGEKYARLHWCETCEQYTEWAGGECQNHGGGSRDDWGAED